MSRPFFSQPGSFFFVSQIAYNFGPLYVDLINNFFSGELELRNGSAVVSMNEASLKAAIKQDDKGGLGRVGLTVLENRTYVADRSSLPVTATPVFAPPIAMAQPNPPLSAPPRASGLAVELKELSGCVAHDLMTKEQGEAARSRVLQTLGLT